MSAATLTGVTCALFDLDGTLIHSRPALVAAYQHAFTQVLGHPVPELESDPHRFLTPRALEVCTMVAGDRAAECVAAYDEHYRRTTYRMVTLFPGIRAMLDGLIARGVAVGIVTNKGRDRARRDLDWVGIPPDSLVALVCAEDTARRKPDAEPVALGLTLAGFAPEESVYVGDGPQDAAAGAGAGLRTIAVLYGYYPEADLRAARPDAVAVTTGELAHLLGGGDA